MKLWRVRTLAPVVVAFACLVFLPRAIVGDRILPAWLPPSRIDAVGSLLKLGCLALGAVYGVRTSRRLEADNPARRPWLLLGLWLGCFALGQGALFAYSVVLGRQAPLPSPGDVAFLVGYALVIAALLRTIRVFHESGFPIGSPREHVSIAAAGTAALGLAAMPLLAPIASADVPMGEKLINLAYPLLDFVALVPTLVLVRITRAFRGGKVSAVWGAILAGFGLMAVADILFAYFSSAKVTGVEGIMDLAFVLGYFAASAGTMLGYELVSE